MKTASVITKQLGLLGMATILMLQTGWVQNNATAQELKDDDQLDEKVRVEPGALCKPHGSPVEKCFICDASLREKGRLWCKEHDRYEDRCFICHPDIKEADRAWCKEHFLYEDECTLCRAPSLKESGGAGNPERDPKRLWCTEHDIYEDECVVCHPELKEQSSRAKPQVLWCKEHDVAEHECGICHPEMIGELSPGSGLKIRFASDHATAKAAVETAEASTARIAGGVEVYAELMFNQNRLTHVALPVDGIIRSVEVDLGDKVKGGDVLAAVTSVEISKAIGDYMRAMAEDRLHEQAEARERKLHRERISSERELQEAVAAHAAADAKVRQARQQLTTLGLSTAQIERLGQEGSETTVLEVRAPFDGEIMERTAVHGALVETGTPLFKVANRSEMWAILNVPVNEVDRIQVGQKVEIILDSAPERRFIGTLTWIAAEVDELTRMAKARAVIPNPEHRLRSGTFARGRIITKTADAAVIVPQSSLQQVDNRPVAFVKLAADLYEARPVTLGAKQDERYEVLSGVYPGETVVVGNSFVMKSQLLLSRLGAGCVDD